MLLCPNSWYSLFIVIRNRATDKLILEFGYCLKKSILMSISDNPKELLKGFFHNTKKGITSRITNSSINYEYKYNFKKSGSKYYLVEIKTRDVGCSSERFSIVVQILRLKKVNQHHKVNNGHRSRKFKHLKALWH